MPNWACGSVSISGTKVNIEKFVSRFIHEEESGTKGQDCRYFARSFTNDRKQSVLDEVGKVFDGAEANAERSFDLSVDFAWSAYSCLIDGYPQGDPECITLNAACVEDQVSAEIITEEGGIGFEEYIFCDKNGELTAECKDLLPYKCKSCGTEQSMASFVDAEEFSCYECGAFGLEAA